MTPCDCHAIIVYGPPPRTREQLDEAAEEMAQAGREVAERLARETADTEPCDPPELDESGMFVADPKPVNAEK